MLILAYKSYAVDLCAWISDYSWDNYFCAFPCSNSNLLKCCKFICYIFSNSYLFSFNWEFKLSNAFSVAYFL